MDKVTVICYQAAEFSRRGETFRIGPEKLGLIIEAPAWIKDTLMFKLLANDGAIKYVEKANKKELENDPMEGITAEGKEAKAEVKEPKKPRQRKAAE